MTIKRAAEMAIISQNACNLSGVAHSFSEVITAVRQELGNPSTGEVNEHPVCKLFLFQMASLAGILTHHTGYSEAHAACVKLMEGQQ